MSLFGPPNIEKMEAKKDVKGLIRVFTQKRKGLLNADERASAASALGRVRDPRAIECLIAELSEPQNNRVYEAVVTALGCIGEPAIEPLVAEWSRHKDKTVDRISTALGMVGMPAYPPLMRILKDPGKQPLHEHIYFALYKMGTPALEPLVDELKDGSAQVRSAFADAMRCHGEDIELLMVLDALKHSGLNREVLRKFLFKVAPTSAYLITTALWESKLTPDWVRVYSSMEIIELEVRWLMNSLPALGIYALVKDSRMIPIPEKAIQALIGLLKDPDAEIRGTAAIALGKMHDAQAVLPLIAALSEDENEYVRCEAVHALVTSGDPRVIDPILNAFNDASPKVRLAAVSAATRIADRRVTRALKNACQDPDKEVRKLAEEILKREE